MDSSLLELVSTMEVVEGSNGELLGSVCVDSLRQTGALLEFQALLDSGNSLSISCGGLVVKNLKALAIDTHLGQTHVVRLTLTEFYVSEVKGDSTGSILLVLLTLLLAGASILMIIDMFFMNVLNFQGVLSEFFNHKH